MSSEIRANTLKNRVGLSTINITNTGIVVSGVSTFSGVSNFNSNVSVSGNLNVAQNIVHTGDTDTKIEFLTDNICFDTAGSERVRITSTGLTTLKNFNGTGLKLEGSGSDYQGIQLQVTDASASQTRNVFIDAVNETGAAVANQVGSIQSDGGSAWIWSTQSPGDRTDRRQERLRIDPNGRTLFSRGGLTASRNVGTKTGEIQLANSGNSSAITIIGYSNDVGGPHLMFGKSRAGNATGSTIVQNGDRLGEIAFCGADGTDIDSFGAAIKCHVDGTPGANDMPGRLQFYTTPDGGTSAQERLRITSLGNFEFGTAVNAGNTLRYFDVANYNTGSNAGVVERLLTTKSDGTSVAGLDIVKYKSGGAYLINYETIGTNGFIAFSTGESGNSPTERVRINGTGNLKIVTAGKGIDFSANSNLSGMTGEVLDHYEMGTYVPTWTSAASPSYYRNGIDSGTSSNGLSYVRIGNQVTVTGAVFWTGGSSINNARPYMSLPFQARIYTVTGTIGNYSLGVTTEIHYLNYDSTTSINLFVQNNSGLHSAFGDNTNGEMYFNITYMTY